MDNRRAAGTEISGLKKHTGFWLCFISNYVSHAFARKLMDSGLTVAGCYWAYLTGRRVVYLSRKGEIHIEEFPRPQA
ncbi:hypothetical protein GOB94_01705 [Granulicella sp. 5B5]|uniref:hypothetical protein n=1 Tax=Granulicella sp. 5B5 TaxID=1617967 RepID=UPI0015F3559F|nr:hypothetical protein [Granulicella sp. 5B5]QMV17557.1 hypothetical protein GOB94_01705 [Granulicella sp. 5B5]